MNTHLFVTGFLTSFNMLDIIYLFLVRERESQRVRERETERVREKRETVR